MNNIWYLSPSCQGSNVGINGYGTEQEQMYLLADAIIPHLDRAGVSFVLADRDASLAQRVIQSNSIGTGFHLCLHSNAGGGGKARGPVALYYSDAGKAFGKKLVDALLALGQENNRSYNLKQEKGLYELRHTAAPACLLEVDFHDSPSGAGFIMSRREEIAEAIARVMIEADGKEFVPTTTGEYLDQAVRMGLFPADSRWNEPMTRSEAAVLAMRLKAAMEQAVVK